MNSPERNTASSDVSFATRDQLAVVSQTGCSITFFDAATHERLDVVDVPAEPHELCFDPDHRVLYCASSYVHGYYGMHEARARQITVIDADTHAVVDVLDTAPDHAPHGLALDRARGLLYVSVEATDTEPGGVIVYDTATRERRGRIPVMAGGPHWVEITPDGRRGYTTNKEAPFVSVLDLERGEFAGRIEVPGSEGLAVSPDGAHVYVAAPKGDFSGAEPAADPGVRVIETATGEIVRTLPTEGVVFPVHTTVTGAVLAGELRMARGEGGKLGAQTNGVLTVFAPGSLEVVGRVEVGVFPLTVTSSPDGRTGYVSAVMSSTVTVVDLTAPKVLATLDVGSKGEAGAHGLAYITAARG
ncbi:YncE family protein [Streptomyces abikoensis]|uniref:YncE family protein n=1 Tax=Streptomyces TaxID=1883 RepID=UPI0013DEE278|nr:YncE family protein [Streptomyces luteoverticillatus]